MKINTKKRQFNTTNYKKNVQRLLVDDYNDDK